MTYQSPELTLLRTARPDILTASELIPGGGEIAIDFEDLMGR